MRMYIYILCKTYDVPHPAVTLILSGARDSPCGNLVTLRGTCLTLWYPYYSQGHMPHPAVSLLLSGAHASPCGILITLRGTCFTLRYPCYSQGHMPHHAISLLLSGAPSSVSYTGCIRLTRAMSTTPTGPCWSGAVVTGELTGNCSNK